MVKNKYFILDLVWYVRIYATYLDKAQIPYIENKFAETEENDYDVVIHEGILYPFEIYDIPIEKYDEIEEQLFVFIASFTNLSIDVVQEKEIDWVIETGKEIWKNALPVSLKNFIESHIDLKEVEKEVKKKIEDS